MFFFKNKTFLNSCSKCNKIIMLFSKCASLGTTDRCKILIRGHFVKFE